MSDVEVVRGSQRIDTIYLRSLVVFHDLWLAISSTTSLCATSDGDKLNLAMKFRSGSMKQLVWS